MFWPKLLLLFPCYFSTHCLQGLWHNGVHCKQSLSWWARHMRQHRPYFQWWITTQTMQISLRINERGYKRIIQYWAHDEARRYILQYPQSMLHLQRLFLILTNDTDAVGERGVIALATTALLLEHYQVYDIFLNRGHLIPISLRCPIASFTLKRPGAWLELHTRRWIIISKMMQLTQRLSDLTWCGGIV